MCLDPEEQKGQPDQRHTCRQEQKPPVNAPSVACGEMMLLVPAITAIESGPSILPTPFAVWPRPEDRAPSRTP
jgi:hypothetical protein